MPPRAKVPVVPASSALEPGAADTHPDPLPGSEPSYARLLAAVRSEVIDTGLAKLSATSVARRAGLARITLYRHGGDVKRLVLSALTCETETVIAAATRDLPDAPGRARFVELVSRLVRGVSGSDFVIAVLGGNVDFLQPYLMDHLGSSQRALLAAAAPELERGMADGSIRRADPRVLGTVLLHALTPFAIAAAIPNRELDEDVVIAEMRRLIDGYLRPTEAPL